MKIIYYKKVNIKKKKKYMKQHRITKEIKQIELKGNMKKLGMRAEQKAKTKVDEKITEGNECETQTKKGGKRKPRDFMRNKQKTYQKKTKKWHKKSDAESKKKSLRKTHYSNKIFILFHCGFPATPNNYLNLESKEIFHDGLPNPTNLNLTV